MILSEKKPLEELLGYLDGERKLFLLGCKGCAEASGTGGPDDVAAMKTTLEGEDKEITGTCVVDFLCQKALVKSRLGVREKEILAADSVVTLCCGLGTQAAAAVIPKKVHPACNTVPLGGHRGEWTGKERCYECGDCLLDYTGGICPLTGCTKSLLNGACGGASKGKCEVDPEKDCGWELIYERLKATGNLDKLKTFIPPKDCSKFEPSKELRSSTLYALEQDEEYHPTKEEKK